MRLVFMGTSSFGIPALTALLHHGHDIVAIVSTPASEKGRGQKLQDSDIAVFAKQHGLSPVLTPVSLKDPAFAETLKQLGADIFVVVAFRILPQEIFSIPKLGTFNIHGSLLPRYRGPAPIHRAIAAGETKTGITVFRIDQGVDTGTIALLLETEIGENETTPQLHDRLSLLGAQGITEVLDSISKHELHLVAQDNSQACGAPKLVKSECGIDWNLPAQTIHNRIRAFKPFPGSKTFLGEIGIGVEQTIVVDKEDKSGDPGTIVDIMQNGILVQCGSGVLQLSMVKPDGKKVMAARDFALGKNIQKGIKLT